jgi:hypothetical protein
MVAEPDFVVSCALVAVIVTAVCTVTDGGVNTPEEAPMLPAFAVQTTALLKFPVP